MSFKLKIKAKTDPTQNVILSDLKIYRDKNMLRKKSKTNICNLHVFKYLNIFFFILNILQHTYKQL